jgi:phosphate transport system permease protein
MAAVTSTPPRPESGAQRGDQNFNLILRIGAIVLIIALAVMVLTLAGYSIPVLREYGLSYFTGSTWRPNATETRPMEFGALPYIFGTVVTSIVALLLATPLAVGAALFVSEYAPKWLGAPIAFVVELLVTIPSVAYGLWGLLVLVPFMRDHVQPFLQNVLGPIPVIGELFKGQMTGQSLLTAGVILAIMILPTILSLSREIIARVPRLQKEGSLALGATKWEMLSMAVLPFAKGGIAGAMVLGLARAIGETMAVTMVVGNASSRITASLFTPGYTIASAIANQFTDANSDVHFSAIVGLGLILLVVASLFNIVARILVRQVTKMPGGAR